MSCKFVITYINRIIPALIIATLLPLCGCEGDKPEGDSHAAGELSTVSADYGGIMVEGSIGDASNLIPILSSDSTSHSIAGMIFNGLVKYDKDMKVTGDLAKSWDISDDGLEITFHLKKGVRWHDGHPFTADDVLFTYRLTIDPRTPTAYAGDFLRVKSAQVIEPHTFRVTYGEPFAPALTSWSASVLPRHLLEEGYNKNDHLRVIQ